MLFEANLISNNSFEQSLQLYFDINSFVYFVPIKWSIDWI